MNMKIKGIDESLLDLVNRTDETVDPIVTDIINLSKIDIYSTMPEPIIQFDKTLLFNALLIANHPKITEAIYKIRRRLKIFKLWEYKKKFEPEEGYINISITNMSQELREKMNNELKIFFKSFGKNIPKDNWKDAISTYILADILPLPLNTSNNFKIYSGLVDSLPKKIQGYVAIVIKKRIRERELNQLIKFIRENKYQIVNATKDLPRETIKRFDVEITKLSIGLWIYKNAELSNEDMERLIDEKNMIDENYFGKYKGLGRVDFPNYKSDALGYLSQLYPL